MAMSYRGGTTVRRSRVITSWINTLVLTVGVGFGVLAFGHHLTPSATTSASATTATTATTTAPTVTAKTLTPISVSFRGDDGSSQSGDR
jgi:hypothetical protein